MAVIGGLLVGGSFWVTGAVQERSTLATMVDPLSRSSESPGVSGTPRTPASRPAKKTVSPVTQGPSSSARTASQPPRRGHVPANTVDLGSPTKRLYDLVQETQESLYQAKGDKNFQEILARLRRTLASDTSLPDTNLAAEKRRFESQLSELHSGSVRTYPGSRTAKIWRGLRTAIDGALQDRRRQRPSPSP